MRVVDLGDGKFEQRKLELNELDHPWIFAAKRHLDALEARLSR